MTRNKMILIFIDSKWRDGKSYTFLARQLNENGVNTILTPFDNWQEAIRLNPRVVVLNHLIGDRNRQIARHVKSYGGKVVILPTEGRPNNDQIADWWMNENANDYDLFLHWNDLFINSADKRHVVVGCTRFDIYPNKQHKSRTEILGILGIDQDKKVVLVASSFPQAKFAYTHSMFNQHDWKDLNRGDAEQNVLNETDEFHVFMSAIDIVVRNNRQWQFIIKPHPMEPSWMWENFCEKNANCKLVTQAGIEDLLECADMLINRTGCITFYDAVSAGVKHIVSFDPAETIDMSGATYEANKAGFVFTNTGKFVSWVNEFDFDEETVNHESVGLVNKHIRNIGSATGLIAKYLSDIYHESESESSSPGCLFESVMLFQQRKTQTNKQNSYPDIDSLHTGKTITDGGISNFWMME